MNRMAGISHLDFVLAHNGDVPENSLEFSRWRQNLVADNAKYVILFYMIYTKLLIIYLTI